MKETPKKTFDMANPNEHITTFIDDAIPIIKMRKDIATNRRKQICDNPLSNGETNA